VAWESVPKWSRANSHARSTACQKSRISQRRGNMLARFQIHSAPSPTITTIVFSLLQPNSHIADHSRSNSVSASPRQVTTTRRNTERRPGETLGAFQARRRRELEEQVDAVKPQPGETPEEFLTRLGPRCQTEDDVIPVALGDDESYYTAAFRRTGRGTGSRVPLASVPEGQAVVLSQPDFVELVPIEGDGNRVDLDEQAERLALTRFLVADQVQTTRTTLARPWPVQCDGLVSSVEIAMRFKDGAPCGYETIVTSGGQAPAAKIRPRPRTGNGGGARREGLS